MPKEWWKSKVFWFNVLALVVMLASAFGFGEFTPDEKWVEIGGIVISVINMLLRLFVTKQPLGSARAVRAARMAPRG